MNIRNKKRLLGPQSCTNESNRIFPDFRFDMRRSQAQKRYPAREEARQVLLLQIFE